jgi:amino acid transporter
MAELKKSMGFWMIAAIAFLNLINTGIFFGAQIGAKEAGVDSLIAWGVLVILSIYVGMCFAELTSMFPSAGGVYEFAKQAYGRYASFLIGWTVWVAGNIATALFTVAAVEYIFPFAAASPHLAPVLSLIAPYYAKIILSIILILFFNYIAYRGIEASARFMIILSIIMVAVLGAAIVIGLQSTQPANLSGFHYQWGLVLLSIVLLSETFFGWEAASYMSEETEDAANVIPKAIVATTIFVAVIALLITIATIGVLGAGTVAGSEKPLVEMLMHLQAPAAFLIAVNIGIVLAILGNVSGNIVSLPRLLLAMSRDKLFIEQFSDIHPKRQTPHKAIIFQTIIAIIIVLLAAGAYLKLLALLVPVSLIMYTSIIILVPYFRWKRPDAERKFKAPFGKVLPLIVGALFAGLLVYWAVKEPGALGQLRLLASFIFFSIPIYLTLTYFYDPDSLIKTISFFSRINLWLENILIPKRVRHDVIEFFTNAKSKHVLEFGSGVGTLTGHLASHVGKEGKVYAVDFSEANVEIIKKRMSRLGHTHVEVIHDPHLINRVHPTVKSADIIVSINNLSYIQDVRKVLKEMNAILPPRGRVYFIEYVDLFYFLPNPKWLDDPDKIREVFREAGFSVTVQVKRGLFWKYLYIYGIKEKRDTIYI